MKTLEKNKGIVMAILIFVVVLYVYSMFKDDIVPIVTQPDQNVGSDLVELFAGLQDVVLNQEFLSSPLYRSLTDFSTELVPLPTGRSNPFNSIGQN